MQTAANFHVLPYLDTNYCYIVSDWGSTRTVAFDAGVGVKLIDIIQEMELPPLMAIFSTHRHEDHCVGNESIINVYPDIPSFGSDYEIVPGRNTRMEPGSVFHMTPNLRVRSMFLKSHTKAALGYYVYDDSDQSKAPLLITGDSIFCAGAGKFVEGHVKEMQVIVERLQKFPRNTLIFPGHEFTEPNLRFAAQAEPSNEDVRQRLQVVQRLRAEGHPTVPSTLEMEFRTNPFLRCKTLARMQIVREAKDRFDYLEGIDHD